MKNARFLILGLLLSQALTSAGCDTIKSRFARQTLPDLGPPIALTVQMDMDPSLSEAKTQYLDGCSRIQQLSIGPTLEDLLVQAAHQTFRTVLVSGGHVTTSKPDMTVRVRMLNPRLNIQVDGLYDRKPAELSLDAFAEFYDGAGKLLVERPLQATRKERLQLELTQQRCDYLMDSILQDTSTMLATQFMQESRALLDPAKKTVGSPTSTAPAAAAAPNPAGSASGAPVASTPALSFKATLLDENNNLMLEAGERVRIRVDVVNTSPQAVQDIVVLLAAPPALLAQFPAKKLSAGTLEPGGSKSLEFVATLPSSVSTPQAEFQVSLAGGTGLNVPPPQTLLASVLPTGSASDDVDQVPAVSAGLERSGDYLLSIGLSSYRDPHIAARKYAALDAEMVATYLQSLGGLPKHNVRLLQDWNALRPDIEEALLDWLPSKITSDSVVTVYFAGQAIVSPAGETFLIPYDGTLEATTRLYPLKDLETALGRLKAKQVLFLFDGTVLKNGTSGRAKVSSPKWNGASDSVLHVIATTGFGKSLESDTLRHGLFTYYILRGLRGEADQNRNGEVTIGELTAYVNQQVPTVARSDFKQDQQPQVLPVPRSSDRRLEIILTKPPVAR